MKVPYIIIFLSILLFGCADSKSDKKSQQKEIVSTISENKSTTTAHFNKEVIGKTHQGKTSISTSVYDIKGVVFYDLLESSQVYNLSFMSNDIVNKENVEVFKNRIQQDFGIHFDQNFIKKNHFYSYKDNFYYSFIIDSIDKNHYSLSFSARDKSLKK